MVFIHGSPFFISIEPVFGSTGCSVVSPVADRPPDVTMYGGEPPPAIGCPSADFPWLTGQLHSLQFPVTNPAAPLMNWSAAQTNYMLGSCPQNQFPWLTGRLPNKIYPVGQLLLYEFHGLLVGCPNNCLLGGCPLNQFPWLTGWLPNKIYPVGQPPFYEFHGLLVGCPNNY